MRKLLEKLSAFIGRKYGGQDLTIQVRVPRLVMICIIVMLILIPTMIAEISIGDYFSLGIEAATFLMQCLVLRLALSGKYVLASDIFSVLSYLVFIGLSLGLEASEVSSIRVMILFLAIPVVLVSLVSLRRIYARLFMILNLPIILLLYFFNFKPAITVSIENQLNPLITLTMLSYLICISVDQMRAITQSLMKETKAESEKNKRAKEKMRQVVDVILESLKKTRALDAEITGTTQEAETILSSVKDLESGSSRLQGGVGDTLKMLQAQRTSLTELSSVVDKQSSAVSESSAFIEEMNSSINNVASIARSKLAAAKTLLTDVKGAAVQLNATAEVFQGITDKVEGIRDVTQIISQIAGQSNILAMNASIEAAHSGTYGRGFAVVAEEMRKLADTSSKNVKRIEQAVVSIIKSVSETKTSMDGTQHTFNSLSREVAKVMNAFDEITLSAEQLSEAGKQMLEATAMLNSVSMQVRENTESMSESERTIERFNESVRAVAENASRQVESIGLHVARINAAMKNLETLSEDATKTVVETQSVLTGEDAI
jgi:methyl-accepting chemotaxis protein